MDASPFKWPLEPESNYDTETDSNDEDKHLLERFLHKRKKHRSRKRTDSLVMEAKQLICEINEGEKDIRTKKKLKGGKIGTESTTPKNEPPKKKGSIKNRLKKELSNPQGLDFANQAGALMAQPSKIEMILPKDLTKGETIPERTTYDIFSKDDKCPKSSNHRWYRLPNVSNNR